MMTDLIEFIESANLNGKTVPTNDAITVVNAFRARQTTHNNALLDKMNEWCNAVAVEWGQGSQTHNIASDAVDIVRAAIEGPSK
jgi:hypothetical protein